MIIDVTGIELTPGKHGKDCLGEIICCNECNYLLCCTERHSVMRCIACDDLECPRTGTSKKYSKKFINIVDKIVKILKLNFY